MEFLSIKFDDFVVENNDIWSQICECCYKKHFLQCDISSIPVNNLICGVEKCNLEADYYLDFLCEKTGQEKN